jgi:hypothetical protein
MKDVNNWLSVVLKMLGIAAIAFSPALLFTWMNFELARGANKSDSSKSDQQIKEEVQSQIKALGDMGITIQTSPDTPYVKEYIQEQIKSASKAEAESAAKGEVEKVKGDLFAQMSFPILAAIASIFAAFVVKDIITEILKDAEKAKIKRDLSTDLVKYLDENIGLRNIDAKNNELDERLNSVESYTYWLEHVLLNLSINQTIDEFESSRHSNSRQADTEFLSAVKELFMRSENVLGRVSSYDLDKNDLDILRKAERKTIRDRLNHLNLSAENTSALQTLLREVQEFKFTKEDSELSFTRMDNIFQAQAKLLIATLSKIPGNEDLIQSVQSRLAEKIASPETTHSSGAKNRHPSLSSRNE